MVFNVRGKHDSWVKCATSVECKSDISAVLTDKSGLDFFMISGVGNGWLVRGFGLGTRWNLVVVLDCPDGNQDGVGQGVGVITYSK